MVVFICGNCGESVKKALVDKHCQTKCRNCYSLSCIDCGKDFPGDTFRSHNQCMTEEEKWHGKDFKPKTGGNTGQKKQDAWTESIQNAISSVKSSNPQLSDVLQKLLGYDNVPRKEAKFKNFLKNSVRVYNHQIVTAVWDIVGKVKIEPSVPPQKPSSSTNGAEPAGSAVGVVSTQNSTGTEQKTESIGDVGETVEPAKKKSRTEIAAQPSISEEESFCGTAARKFRWKKEIRDILSQSESRTLSQKKLRKRVLQRYETSKDLSSTHTEQDDSRKTFEKYLEKYPDLFNVEDNVVKLIAA